MKQTTKDWLTFAEDDLLAARALSPEDRLSNLVAFHCHPGIPIFILRLELKKKRFG
jgi:hypothetical protein